MMLIVVDVRRYGVRSALVRALLFAVATLPAALLFARHWQFFRGYYMTANQWHAASAARDGGESYAERPVSVRRPSGGARRWSCLIVYALWQARAGAWEIADVAVVYWPVSIGLFSSPTAMRRRTSRRRSYAAPGVVCAAVTLARAGSTSDRAAWPPPW